MSKVIMGIELQKRHKSAPHFQDILTEYGCYINTRIGLHQGSGENCSEKGLILLEFIDEAEDKALEFEQKIEALDNAVVKKMVF